MVEDKDIISNELSEEITPNEQKRRAGISKTMKESLHIKRFNSRETWKKYVNKRKAKKSKADYKQHKEDVAKRKKEREKIQKFFITEVLKIKKRKPGRPPKRGRKKKRIYKKNILPVNKTIRQKHFYKIVISDNLAQKTFIDTYKTTKGAYKKFKKMKEESAKVRVPRLITANETKNNTDYECLLLEKNFDGTKKNSKTRDDFGNTINQETSHPDWVIVDKFPYQMEETFWVWGYDPRKERKTAEEIYNNVLSTNFSSEYDIKRIILYKNKVVSQNDDDTYDIVFCKTKNDALRLYNALEKLNKEKKEKQIVFIGSFDSIRSDSREKLEKGLMKQTGWTLDKIRMAQTKFYASSKSKEEENN